MVVVWYAPPSRASIIPDFFLRVMAANEIYALSLHDALPISALMGDAEGVASYVTVNVPVWLANAVFCHALPPAVKIGTAHVSTTVTATLRIWSRAPLVNVTTSVYEPATVELLVDTLNVEEPE